MLSERREFTPAPDEDAMKTLVAPAICRHAPICVPTGQPLEFVDLTERIAAVVSAAEIRTGLVNVQSRHTTTAIVLNEREPLLHDDFAALLDRAAAADAGYRHDDLAVRTVNLTPGERRNGHAHCRALLLGSSVAVNVAEGRLQLGQWQRVFLVELDGPREREVSLLVMGESAR
jgi:secondary thiamine-phosphate synthase enzyme